MRELRRLVSEEEKHYAQAGEYIATVRQAILSSQGFLGKWQSTLLSQAYESLDQGNYTAALEWAKQANDLPLEPAREEADPSLRAFLWTASFALLGVVTMLILFRAVRRSGSITMTKGL